MLVLVGSGAIIRRMNKFTAERQDETYLKHVDGIRSYLLQHYLPELPYHNVSHAKHTIDVSEELRGRIQMHLPDEAPSQFVTAISAAGHDAGYPRYHRDTSVRQQHDTAEDYACHITEGALRDQAVDEATRNEIKQNIISTRLGQRCKTWGQLILCEADLDNTTRDFQADMVPATQSLRHEYYILGGKRHTEALFFAGSLGVLATYQHVNLHFPRRDQAGPELTRRHERRRQNLQLLGETILADAQVNATEAVQKVQSLGQDVLHNIGIKLPE